MWSASSVYIQKIIYKNMFRHGQRQKAIFLQSIVVYIYILYNTSWPVSSTSRLSPLERSSLVSIILVGCLLPFCMQNWYHWERDCSKQTYSTLAWVAGYTLYHLWYELSLITSIKPQVLLLDISSDDLSFCSLSPHNFVQELREFIKRPW